MQEGDFKDGIKKIQIALQVETNPKRRTPKDNDDDFRPDFLIYLWKVFERSDPVVWAAATEKLCLFRGKPVAMTASDFMGAVKEAREAKEIISARWKIPPEVQPPDYEKFYGSVLLDPQAPDWLRKTAQEWADRKAGRPTAREAAAGKGERSRAARNEGGNL